MVKHAKRLFTKENLIMSAVIFVAIFLTKFPTLYNWLNTPKGYWYPQNTSWFDAWDINAYVSYIRYGQRAGVFLENTYTTLVHPKEFIFQFYTSLGVLNRFLHLDPFILFHTATIATDVILILSIYWVISIFIQDKKYQLPAFIIAVLGGGLGWVSFLHNLSADYITAGFTLVNALERGHDALSTAFLLLSLTSIFLYTTSKKNKYLIYGILSVLGSIVIHPPLVILYISVAIVASLFHDTNRERVKSLIYPLVLFLTFAIYYVLFLRGIFTNPGFLNVGQTMGSDLSRISSLSLSLGFGLLTPFLLWAIVFVQTDDKEFSFAKLILLAQLFFVFFPFSYNLYFTKGLFIWGVIVAFYGIRSFTTNMKVQRIVLTLVVAVSVVTRLHIFTSLVDAKLNNPFFFLTKGEGDALSFMSSLPAESAVLSFYRIGNYIPAHTDSKVYYGHKYLTPNSAETLRRAQIFYTLANEAEQRKFLQDNHIDYIYYGLEEAQLRKDNNLNPRNPFPYFSVLYSNNTSIIYKIQKPAKI